MTNAEDKIRNEWRIMESFIKRFHDFPKGDLVKSESPDFLLNLNPKKKIGIELTLFHAESGFIESINFIIRQKDEKIPIYKQKKLDSCWLVIYIIPDSLPYRFQIQNKLQKHSFTSLFQKVFVFNMATGKIFQVVG